MSIEEEMQEMELFTPEDFAEEDAETTNDGDELEEEGEQDDEIDEETSEDVEAEEETDPEDTKPTKIRLKTRENHEDVEQEYEESELVAHVQRSKDYDRVKEQANRYRNDPRLSFVDNLARQQNMTSEQYMAMIANSKYDDMLDELLQSGIDEPKAKRLVDAQRKADQAETPAQSEDEKELTDFMAYYAKVNGKQFDPNVDTLPDAVWLNAKVGTPLKMAYMEYLLEQKQTAKQEADAATKEQQEKKKQEVRAKAPVRATNGGVGKLPKKDPIFDGLFED